MRKIIFIFLSMLLLPISVRADFDQQKTVDYLKNASQDYWITQALYQLGETDIDGGHLLSVICDSAIDCAGPILGITALGEDPRTFTGEDLIAKLKSFAKDSQLGEVNLLNDDIWGILALISAGVDSLDSTVVNSRNYLLNHQNEDGGWGWSLGPSDIDDTAAAVMALLEVGLSESDVQIQNAINYIKNAQNQNAGFPYDPVSLWGTDSTANSTAWALSMIYKLGQNPEAGDWAKEGSGPVSFLENLQNDSGYFGYQSAGEIDNAYSAITTAQAAIALAGGYYPVRKISYSPPPPPPTGGGSLLPLIQTVPPKISLTSQTYIPTGVPAKVEIKDENGRLLGEIIIPEKLFTQSVTLFAKALKKEELSEVQQSINLISPYVYEVQILDGDQKEIIVFEQEIEMKLFYKNDDLSNLIKLDELQLVYFNKELSKWIALEKNQVDSSLKSVRALTKHFTLFAISYGLETEKPKDQKTEKQKNLEEIEKSDNMKEVLSYPDGALIKAIDSPAVYLIEQGRKRWIPNEKILRFRFLGQEIEFVDQEIINILPEGMEVLYPNGAYLRSLEDGRIYRIKNNKKYQVISLETWLYICDQESPALIDVEIKELNKYETGGLVV